MSILIYDALETRRVFPHLTSRQALAYAKLNSSRSWFKDSAWFRAYDTGRAFARRLDVGTPFLGASPIARAFYPTEASHGPRVRAFVAGFLDILPAVFTDRPGVITALGRAAERREGGYAALVDKGDGWRCVGIFGTEGAAERHARDVASQ